MGIIGMSDLAAFGANLGIVAILGSALIIAWMIRTKSSDQASRDRDG